MSWYNNAGDLWGDVKSIGSGKNPSNGVPPVNIPAKGPPTGGIIPMAPLPGTQTTSASTQPVNPSIPASLGDDSSILDKLAAIPGLGTIVEGIRNGGGSLSDVLGKIPGGAAIAAAIKSGAIDIGKIGGFLKDNAGTILEAANVANAAWRQGKSDDFAKQAMSTAQSAYDAKAPLRVAGIQGMLNPQGPDLSSLKSIAGQNTLKGPLAMAPQDMSRLDAISNRASTIQAPTPRGAPDLSNLSALAGSGSGNPFATALPLAGAPAPTVNAPSTPNAPPPRAPIGFLPSQGATPTAIPSAPSGHAHPGGPTNLAPPDVTNRTPVAPVNPLHLAPDPLTPMGNGTTAPGSVPNGSAPTIPVGMAPPPGWVPPGGPTVHEPLGLLPMGTGQIPGTTPTGTGPFLPPGMKPPLGWKTPLALAKAST